MVSALSIKDLRKVYANGTEALKGVSLDVPAGDFFALLGPNGAGKTSIIGTIVSLVTKTSGTVKVFDVDIDKDPAKAKHYIGIVPQEINLNPFARCIDIVVDQAGYYGIPRSVALPRAEKIFKDVGLFEKRNDVSRTLSGGMKRRLMIVRALIHQPKFLVLDEPTAGVDVELRRGMWDYLKTLTSEGLTILLTTHYLEEAEQLAKHIAIINKGEIIKSGTLKEILGVLKTETLLLDIAGVVSSEVLSALASYNPKKIDETTIEIQIGEGNNVSKAIDSLTQKGVSVQTIRNKSGRLEEVFMHLTSAK